MNKKNNKYINVAYKLYTNENGEQKLIEEATEDKPFLFITGLGIALEDFENNIKGRTEGEEFTLEIPVDRAYGKHNKEYVLQLDKAMFYINNHFDHDNIFIGAVVPLQNEEGQRFMGKVLDITIDRVVIDLNHPLAGKDLTFKGKVIENRDATNEEIASLINGMNGGGCGCGNNDGECSCSGHEEKGSCGCGCH